MLFPDMTLAAGWKEQPKSWESILKELSKVGKLQKIIVDLLCHRVVH